MTASTIPAAIDALLAQIEAVADASTKVVDGFPRFDITNADLIAVGGSADPTASGSQEPSDEAEGRLESYALQLRAGSYRGAGTPQSTVRARAFALMAVVDEAVQSDPSLGGVVYRAELGGAVDLFQTEKATASGTQAEVAFSVLVQAEV